MLGMLFLGVFGVLPVSTSEPRKQDRAEASENPPQTHPASYLLEKPRAEERVRLRKCSRGEEPMMPLEKGSWVHALSTTTTLAIRTN